MGDYFYIVEEGTVGVVVDGTEVAQVTNGGIFGEKALLKEDKRAATIVTKTPVTLLALGREDFVGMLGNVSELGGTADAEDPMFARAETEAVTSDAISGDNLTVIRTLGCGAFGRVKLAEHKSTGECYALKCQTKSAIIDNCLQDHILNERKILMQLDHQFILKIHDAYQDEAQIYFVLELLLGGELFTHLRQVKSFAEKSAKFYAAQVLLAFQHIHKKKIAYRDLKPENLVLTTDGYCKIVDFGLAKVVDGKTWTLCGTPDYLAPEIILNEGHDKAVDYWALGVLIFEMVAGEPPFYADDPMEVYEKILSATMQIPTKFSKNLSDIVRKLLKIYQSKRLGNGKGGCSAIVKHKWFYGFDWELLLTKSMSEDQIPINPKCKSPTDISNFDPYDETDEQEPPCEPPWNPEFD
jgi:serine/threonine protein kinase